MAGVSNRYQTYIWLLETITRNEGITLDKINDLWVQTNLSDGKEFARTTFVRYISDMENLFNVIVKCNRKDNTYYIDSDLANKGSVNVKRWLLSTMSITSVLQKSPAIQNRIVLEHVPSGDLHLIYITRAMEEGRTLKVRYQKFVDSEPYVAELEPYCLKLFHQRWYLLAHRVDRTYLAMYALDRMLSLEVTDNAFFLPRTFTAEKHFKPMFGVFQPSENEPCQQIRIRTYGGEWNYLRTLPLHPSQRQVEVTSEYVDFTFKMCPTRDLQLELLSRGSRVEVLEPAQLRQQMKELIREAAVRYESDEGNIE